MSGDPHAESNRRASGIEAIQPGVDAAAARTTKAAGAESLSASGLAARDRERSDAAERGPGGVRRGLWLVIGAVIAIVVIVVLALLVPTAPALAWIGIALQVALAVLLVVSALVLPAGGYRASRFVWITGFQVAAAVVVLVLILIVALV